MADEQKPSFDAGAFLRDQDGLLFAGMDDKGPLFRTPDGQTVPLDVPAYLGAHGIPVDKVNIEYNSPGNARDDSPVSLWDRTKLALGNTKGQIGYLKSKFDDANFVEGKGLVVKQQGVWHKVDSSSMDPWELTKDVVEGAVSFLPGAVAAAQGAAEGATMGAAAGPGGAIAGGIIGAGAGGAAAEGARSSLGRLAGTYDATPAEQLRDVGFEALLNMGGQAVAVAARPTLKMLGNAAKDIASRAAPASKDILSEAIARTTNTTVPQVQTMLGQTDEVVRELGAAGAGKVSSADVQLALRQGQIEAVDQMVAETPKALTQRFGEQVETLARAMPAGKEVNVGGVVRNALQDMETKGWGQVVERAGAAAEGQSILKAGPSSKPVFELFSNPKALERIIGGAEGTLLDPESHAAVKQMASLVNEMMDAGTARGKNAAEALMSIKRAVNQTARSLTGGNTPPAVTHFVNDFRSALVNQIGKEFDSAGVKEAYVATATTYERYAAAADLARSIARSVKGSEELLNKLVQGVGANQTYKDLAGDMVELLGARGESLMGSVNVKEAAKGFAPMLPKKGVGIGLGGLATAGAASGVISAPVAIAGAAMTSPRLVLKQVQYGKQMLGFLQGLSPSARTQWLRDPRLVDATIREVAKAPFEEDAHRQQLLNQAGIR